ncbi:hypothetical protein Taro_001985 [Colocasia esculenta]|uniref:Uncharacterized protein n=1 Tax=Colocasia esculenta TaxID=4460 RepID=A0A843TKD9_COLES|nr:hypothetical protein [Colocasia esculenta]
MGLRERQLDLSSVAVRLRGRPVWFVRHFLLCYLCWFARFLGSFPTELMTREVHPYLLPDLMNI